MILATAADVKRSLWVIFGALVLLAAAVLLRSDRSGDAVAVTHPPSPPAPAPEVRVRQELVTATVTAEPVAAVSRPAAPPAVKRAAHEGPRAQASPPVRAAARDTSLLGRARRAVVGDGRYRPEPFPRVKDN
jgi:hypothetical protein